MLSHLPVFPFKGDPTDDLAVLRTTMKATAAVGSLPTREIRGPFRETGNLHGLISGIWIIY